jgi:hypothetical protein
MHTEISTSNSGVEEAPWQLREVIPLREHSSLLLEASTREGPENDKVNGFYALANMRVRLIRHEESAPDDESIEATVENIYTGHELFWLEPFSVIPLTSLPQSPGIVLPRQEALWISGFINRYVNRYL